MPPPGAIGLPFMSKGTPWYGYVALNAITTLLPAVVTYVARAKR
ncbi:hypothetical protein OCK02_25505 [Rhizobium sp. TRM96647]|nr:MULTISPECIES: hypothetical protein [unclassified Rhizobium]MCV3739498.1 hypothetical protein [Rhizobium sp. TRM96647]MCV3761177.1 hypothetical protein [Rhizobium sp. TRM96650]